MKTAAEIKEQQERLVSNYKVEKYACPDLTDEEFCRYSGIKLRQLEHLKKKFKVKLERAKAKPNVSEREMRIMKTEVGLRLTLQDRLLRSAGFSSGDSLIISVVKNQIRIEKRNILETGA